MTIYYNDNGNAILIETDRADIIYNFKDHELSIVKAEDNEQLFIDNPLYIDPIFQNVYQLHCADFRWCFLEFEKASETFLPDAMDARILIDRGTAYWNNGE